MEAVCVRTSPALFCDTVLYVPPVTTKREACKQEILAFARGGPGGLARLREVLPSIFVYFEIITLEEKSCILRECSLTPLINAMDISFVIQAPDSDSSV